MNLHRMLKDRERDGKPVRVGLIGAGKFGTMFLAQARRTPWSPRDGGGRSRSLPAPSAALARAGWQEDERRARSFSEALQSGGTHVMRGRVRADRGRRPGRRHRRDRPSRRRHRPCPRLLCRRAPRGDGQRRGRRALRSAAGKGGGGGRRGLFARLRRPAGADRRDGRLGARVGPRCRRRRQGHPVISRASIM